jgi:hypothetical protein
MSVAGLILRDLDLCLLEQSENPRTCPWRAALPHAKAINCSVLNMDRSATVETVSSAVLHKSQIQIVTWRVQETVPNIAEMGIV